MQILLLVAIIGEFLVPYTLALFYPGYSHTSQVMSVLGNPKSPVKVAYNIWLFLLGILFLVISLCFYYRYFHISSTLSIIGMILLIMYGIGACIVSALFTVNETKGLESTSEKIHGISAGIGFIALAFMPVVLGYLYLKTDAKLISLLFFSLFITNILLFTLFVISEKESFAKTILGKTGLWQRLLLAGMYIPLLIISLV